MKSLMILGFKRCMSSAVYNFYFKAIPELNKTSISDGEIINRNESLSPFCKYPHNTLDDEKYKLQKDVFDLFRSGYLIKEVTQPYSIVRYMKENPEAYNVIYMDRDLDHIEFACKNKIWEGMIGWEIPPYPELCRMREEMISISNGVIDVNLALKDYNHIFDVARNLGYTVNGWDYINDNSFQNRTKNFFNRFEFGKKRMYEEREKEIKIFNKNC